MKNVQVKMWEVGEASREWGRERGWEENDANALRHMSVDQVIIPPNIANWIGW